MNYQSIHDTIINRAKTREYNEGVYESHHIIPKCEDGSDTGDQVFLTQKEHRLIHKLRFKINGIVGNYLAYNLMRYGRDKIDIMRKEVAILGGKSQHRIMKETSLEVYSERQRKAGYHGGVLCREKKLGFFNCAEEERKLARDRGRKTIVENKIGMFSDEYREQHRKSLFKKVNTPDGVFESLTEAANYYKISRSTVTYRLKSRNFSDWYLLKEEK